MQVSKSINSSRDPKTQLEFLGHFLNNDIPFQYVRFSDGEVEILCERLLQITESVVEFRGTKVKSVYQAHDAKKFFPDEDVWLKAKLKEAATYITPTYIKGIPTKHNSDFEKGLLIGFNGGVEYNLSFSDLFMNNNYSTFTEKIKPVLLEKTNLVVANHQAKIGSFSSASLFPIPNNAFQKAKELTELFEEQLAQVQSNGIIVSSASSLSNIFGALTAEKRPDVTFIDVGTAINGMLGLPYGVRRYQRSYDCKKPWLSLKVLKYRLSSGYKLKW